MIGRNEITISRSMLETRRALADTAAPREAVALLAGPIDDPHVIDTLYPVANEAPGDDEFVAAAGLFEPFRLMRQRGQDLRAIVHSHPRSPAVPSAKDIARNHYPTTPHIIISLSEGTRAEPTLGARAWLLEEPAAREITLAIAPR